MSGGNVSGRALRDSEEVECFPACARLQGKVYRLIPSKDRGVGFNTSIDLHSLSVVDNAIGSHMTFPHTKSASDSDAFQKTLSPLISPETGWKWIVVYDSILVHTRYARKFATF